LGLEPVGRLVCDRRVALASEPQRFAIQAELKLVKEDALRFAAASYHEWTLVSTIKSRPPALVSTTALRMRNRLALFFHDIEAQNISGARESLIAARLSGLRRSGRDSFAAQRLSRRPVKGLQIPAACL
jgi:hypothetical protein